MVRLFAVAFLVFGTSPAPGAEERDTETSSWCQSANAGEARRRLSRSPRPAPRLDKHGLAGAEAPVFIVDTLVRALGETRDAQVRSEPPPPLLAQGVRHAAGSRGPPLTVT